MPETPHLWGVLDKKKRGLIMKNSKEENAILETLHPDFGQLRLTKTMLEKSIIDANVSIRRFAKLFQVDFETMKAGEKTTVEAIFADGTPCKVSFYKTNNRGDRRLSISGIKKQAQINDLLAFDFVRNHKTNKNMIVINVTAAIQNKKQLKQG